MHKGHVLITGKIQLNQFLHLKVHVHVLYSWKDFFSNQQSFSHDLQVQ
jgi:hypothetical protein